MSTPRAAASPGPLLVRLHNWIGDVTVGVPALTLIAAHGFDLTLVGKPWAVSLLAGHGWPTHALADGLRARGRQWRALRAAVRPRGRIEALLLATSFSSALECRLGGVRAMGHDTDLRSLLLARSVPRPTGVHAVDEAWHLACAFLGIERPPPEAIGLAPSADHVRAARERLAAHGMEPGRYVFLCPFAIGTFEGISKSWPGFPEFARRLEARGVRTLVVPGPGAEEEQARRGFPASTVFTRLSLGEYAALLGLAALVVANDTGPGHVAAAVGAPLFSVFGPTDPDRWAPRGPTVQVVQSRQGRGTWPTVDEVLARIDGALTRAVGAHSAPGSSAALR